jgi:hypothetical protein
MKRNLRTVLPENVANPLRKVVKVLYYRFEFARGEPDYGRDFGKHLEIEYDSGDRKWPERAFPRIANRMLFLSAPGTATYLDDLKKDLRGASPKAIDLVRHFAEVKRMPICPSASILTASHMDPFFPSARNVGDRLLDYMRQLFDVQEFLHEKIHVRPGALLPTWIISLNDCAGAFPSLGVLPVRRSTVNALIAYLMWELDLDFGSYLHEPPMDDHNNRAFLDEALGWARLATFRCVREYDIANRTDEPFDCVTREKKTILRKIRHELPDYLKDFQPSWASEVFRELNRRGKIAEPIIRPFTTERTKDSDEGRAPLDQPSDHNERMVQSTTFISRVNRALKRGEELYWGGYKDLW